MGISPKTANGKIFRARKKLQTLLERRRPVSREEKLLKELLESYWEEKWKEMPDREEIAGEHDFSEDFQNKIRKIGRKRKKKKYLTAAAAAVLLLFAAVQGESGSVGDRRGEIRGTSDGCVRGKYIRGKWGRFRNPGEKRCGNRRVWRNR